MGSIILRFYVWRVTLLEHGPVSNALKDGFQEGFGALLLRVVEHLLGVPSSRMTPSLRKIARLATSRAKPISCVTTTIVMPSCGELAHRPQHLADQLGVERGGRLVEEHQLGVHGERARDGDALLLAAGEARGIGVGFLG